MNKVVSRPRYKRLVKIFFRGRLKFEVAGTIEQRGASVVKNSVFDDSKIRALGWFPQWSLFEAIRETIEILKSSQTSNA